ncbi:sulfite oxidase heme-binding subunit YedZ [Paracoccus tegillarcae]|uniref:Protein-methionine-sulfoxide reductase heme-binding subunit MsrQ n=1 Tax=Paracoccus tegillarcae TaxID=1529068 RepID=A0A2K9EDW4_9RHOB|nr:protein-methionine-sulfoxide reductase heme-binding subunit MsrQ [Paracoccus tegillarcae]AUH33148.1 sulfoxide reductase heme-binding subunit YedZ [Paracoccus tegillarcae]
MAQVINGYLRRIPVWAVWLGAAIPLALLVWDTLTGGLGVEPVRDIEHRLGRTALYFLIATLAVTPLMRITRISLLRFRRALGLISFTYAALHVASWISMEMGFLWGQMLTDVIKRPYLIFGMSAFVMLFALAVTSNDSSIRRLGAAGWRRLHRLVYPAVLLASIHWIWALKLWETKPLLVLGMILVLLALRVLIRRPLGRRPAKVQTN